MIENDGYDIELARDIKISMYVRIKVVVFQIIGIIITWLCQKFTDVYLITVPVTFLIFVIILFTAWEWWDDEWWNKAKFEELEELPDGVDEATEFLDYNSLFLKLNCALSACNLAINEFVALKREAFHNPDPAFFKMVPNSQLVQRGNLKVVSHDPHVDS